MGTGWMDTGLVLDGYWMTGYWMGTGWVLDGWVLDGYWMDGYWMGTGWVLDGSFSHIHAGSPAFCYKKASGAIQSLGRVLVTASHTSSL